MRSYPGAIPGTSPGSPAAAVLLDEDVILRYNAGARTIEIVIPATGTVRTVAGFITAFNMQYLNQFGAATAVGNDVRSVQVAISGGSRRAHPQTRQTYGITEACTVQLVSK